jgi:hypothetical protein
LAKIQG